jgi:hypothetical protein
MDIFSLINLVISLLIFGAFLYRYKQTGVKYYQYLGLATLGFAISAGLLAFLLDLKATLVVYIVYGAVIISAVSGLAFVLCVLHMLQTWVQSMRQAAFPTANKLDMADKVCNILRYVYPACTATLVVIYVLIMFTLTFAAMLAMVVGLVYAVAIVAQFAVIIWMYLDIHSVSTESQLTKRNQLIRIAAMCLFCSGPAMFGGLGVGIAGSLCWWIWYGIALWPGALVGFDEKPDQVVGFGNPMHVDVGAYPKPPPPVPASKYA